MAPTMRFVHPGWTLIDGSSPGAMRASPFRFDSSNRPKKQVVRGALEGHPVNRFIIHERRRVDNVWPAQARSILCPVGPDCAKQKADGISATRLCNDYLI